MTITNDLCSVKPGDMGEIVILRKLRKNVKKILVILKFEMLPLIVPKTSHLYFKPEFSS